MQFGQNDKVNNTFVYLYLRREEEFQEIWNHTCKMEPLNLVGSVSGPQ